MKKGKSATRCNSREREGGGRRKGGETCTVLREDRKSIVAVAGGHVENTAPVDR